ncbi:MAG: hypothetical protein GXX86_04615 [Propionibacterium sp.]|nr:hypothetical protein [Propionibacterium sp.]
MPSMTRLLAEHTELAPHQVEHLKRLVREWHLVADLAFSDLVLWVPDEDPNIMWAVAQIRPTTGATAVLEDVVGESITYEPEELVVQAFLSGETVATSDNQLSTGIPVDIHARPVILDGQVIAVLEQHTNRIAVRALGAMEDSYVEIAELLIKMIGRHEFPMAGEPFHPGYSPRVGDGLIWMDAMGNIIYASPNAVSSYRRLGFTLDLLDITGQELIEQAMPDRNVDALALIRGNQVREFTVQQPQVGLRGRLLPLRELPEGAEESVSAGAVVLVRDITEVLRQERELVTKDATIREIHHRVKNNLQTVAALLRMQSRRMESAESRQALGEAMSRVAAIAAVHELLSQSYDEDVLFDDVADRVMKMVSDVAGPGVRVRREGSFGSVSAESATALSLVVTELCQNSIEHGLAGEPGEVIVQADGNGGWLEVSVLDAGRGLPPDFSTDRLTSLGLSIVRSLVTDLDGTFELVPRDGRGSAAIIRIPRAAGRRQVDPDGE